MINNKSSSTLWQKRWDEQTKDELLATTAGVDNTRETSGFSRQVNLLSDTLKLKSTDRILDIGCNRGLYLAALAPRVEHISGIDYAGNPIEEAKKNTASYPNVDVQMGDALALPFKSNSFDKILMVSVLQYLDEESHKVAFEEMARVLKRDGLAYVSLIPDATKKKEYFDGIEKLQKTPEEKKEIRERNNEIVWFDFNKLVALATGFKVVVVSNPDFVWFSRYTFSLLLEKI